jgi:ferric-dicitrate binding protein FerR (iron transport regulator)
VSISKVGRVELAPNSNLKLTFTENSIMGLLESGSAHVSTLAGVTVNITTKDGAVVADGSQATSFVVSLTKGNTTISTQAGVVELRTGGAVKKIAAGESFAAGMPNPQAGSEGDDLTGGELAVLLLAVGGAVAAVLYAALHNNDLNFGGTVNVISPTK